jgi:CheY-like chemotaxis protein
MAPPSSRILVVDDNDALRENLAEALQLEGYPVVMASDGPGALLRLAEDPPPTVVLLDLMLPGMSGSDVLSRIRADARLAHVKVVITTGASHSAARATPADAVLMKPFGVAELLAALRKVGVGA